MKGTLGTAAEPRDWSRTAASASLVPQVAAHGAAQPVDRVAGLISTRGLDHDPYDGLGAARADQDPPRMPQALDQSGAWKGYWALCLRPAA